MPELLQLRRALVFHTLLMAQFLPFVNSANGLWANIVQSPIQSYGKVSATCTPMRDCATRHCTQQLHVRSIMTVALRTDMINGSPPQTNAGASHILGVGTRNFVSVTLMPRSWDRPTNFRQIDGLYKLQYPTGVPYKTLHSCRAFGHHLAHGSQPGNQSRPRHRSECR